MNSISYFCRCCTTTTTKSMKQSFAIKQAIFSMCTSHSLNGCALKYLLYVLAYLFFVFVCRKEWSIDLIFCESFWRSFILFIKSFARLAYIKCSTFFFWLLQERNIIRNINDLKKYIHFDENVTVFNKST